MEEKIKAIQINMRSLLNRIEKLKLPEKTDYELTQLVKELSENVYEISGLIEKIEMLSDD